MAAKKSPPSKKPTPKSSVKKTTATARKPAQRKKTPAKAAPRGAAKKGKAAPRENPLVREAVNIALVAAGVLFILTMYTENGAGALGSLLKPMLRGLFGFGAYTLPAIVIAFGIFAFLKNVMLTAPKLILFVSVFFLVISFVHVLNANHSVQYVRYADSIKGAYEGGSLSNGGLVGAFFGNIFLQIFGTVGSYIILLTMTLILFILLTGKSVYQGTTFIVRKISDFFYVEDYEEYEDEPEYEVEEENVEEDDEEEIPVPKVKRTARHPVKNAAKKAEAKTVPDKTEANAKAAMFVIEERPERKDFDPGRNKILLVNEEITDGNKKITVLKELKNRKITDAITMDPVEQIQHPVTGRQDIKLNGFFETDGNKNSSQPVAEPPARNDRKSSPEPDHEETELYNDAFYDAAFEADMEMAAVEEPDEDGHFHDENAIRDEIFIRTAGHFEEEGPDGGIDDTESGMDERNSVHMEEALHEKVSVQHARPNQPDMNTPSSRPVQLPAKADGRQNLLDQPRDILFGHAEKIEYIPPGLEILNKNPASSTPGSRAQILENSRKLEETLKSFGVEAKVVEVSKGPTVTRYELSPGQGVKVSKISGLADDLALNLAAVGIRIEAPIPGKAAVGIEIPNKEVTPVFLREVLEDEAFIKFPSKLAFGLGKDIAGNTVVADIAKMPHLLIAGATGSGKSVCINTLVTSIIYKATPDEVKLLMVDPKVVELSVYNGIPHLLIPVVTEPRKASGALNWAVQEMITRYGLFAETGTRDLKGYNTILKERGEENLLPQIVIIIDELADLMMAAPGEVEDAICRLAQMARAAGLHLIIATQRPSVDVITGLIKANIPSRMAFAVSSGTDSRTVLDMVGAEKLLGKGDMLFCPVGMGKPLRVQGAFISDKEVESIVNFVKQGRDHEYDQSMIDRITETKNVGSGNDDVDEFFEQAVSFIIEKDKASASLLQRQFRIGYNRASRLIEDLEARGIIGPEDGSKPRKVLLTSYQWNEMLKNRG